MSNSISSDVSDEWLEEHKRSLTASDAAAACGLAKYADPKALWEVKTNRIERSHEDTDSTAHGKRLEPLIREAYCGWMRYEVSVPSLHFHNDPSISYMGASPDALVTEGETEGKKVLVEIKCPSHSEWDYIPVSYMAQVQMQLEVFEYDAGDFVVYYDHLKRVRIWRVYRNKIYWKWLRTKLELFWNHCKSDTPPNDIDWIYRRATELETSKYKNYSSMRYSNLILRRLTRSSPQERKDLPPRVHSVLTHEFEWDVKEAANTQKSIARTSSRLVRKRLINTVVFIICVVICLSYLPFVL